MILADTSVWIEYLRGREPIYSRFDDFLRLGRILSVPWVFGELLQGAPNETDLLRIMGLWHDIPKPKPTELDDIWISAGYWSSKNRWAHNGVGLVDAAIIQAARTRGATVWTLDKRLRKALPPGHRFS